MKILYIDDILHESLRKKAKRQGRTLTWTANEAIEGYLNKVRYARQGDPRKGEPYSVELGNSVDGYKEPTVTSDSQDPDDGPVDLGELLK